MRYLIILVVFAVIFVHSNGENDRMNGVDHSLHVNATQHSNVTQHSNETLIVPFNNTEVVVNATERIDTTEIIDLNETTEVPVEEPVEESED